MPDPILRRRNVPRLHMRPNTTSGLPSFLRQGCAVPMAPAPVPGPLDTLEQAILDGEVWDQHAGPVEIQGFDADQDVISVIIEKGGAPLHFDMHQGRDGMQILANGSPMAYVVASGRACTKSNIRVMQARNRL